MLIEIVPFIRGSIEKQRSNSMKKGLLFVLVLAMLALVSTAAFADGVKVALVTDTGGINDQSFNASAWEGMLKAQAELGAEIKYF